MGNDLRRLRAALQINDSHPSSAGKAAPAYHGGCLNHRQLLGERSGGAPRSRGEHLVAELRGGVIVDGRRPLARLLQVRQSHA